MATLPRNLSRAALLGVASTIALSSCALPPREAWRKIQDDGLIAYIKYELETPRHGAPTTAPAPATPVSPTRATPGSSRSGEMVLAQRNFVESMKNEESRTPLTAFSVPALPGYVRSPYTNPPRLVDVRGVPSGTTMVCPYTHRKFIVPGANGAVPTPSTMLAQDTSRVQAPERTAPPVKQEAEAPRVVLNDKPVSTPTPPAPAPTKPIENNPVTTPSAPTVASSPAPALSAPTKAPAAAKEIAPTKPTPTPNVAKNTPPVKPSPPVVAAPTPPAPKPVQEIPYGEAIAGRPGFVNSPYAAKHQLVDVTGLPAGMEVKCPYTGKLFRVPMQDMASSKPVETVPPLASPQDKPQKK
ncbi:hypothetical protein DES53_101240 [Roseimicrobium gellanilyticum]|uniref:Uncharacterized protein n=1 Tax=Roseimicrobium gellanilyticum TaxID=748857 RepID=A0A366HT45_9BACT|nr:hypothetical protein [Roseimicrobium gellanilyticum]RBP47443.1 hypothetical protein DES53_101240 [Roseimicrobium gellanilyticum]